MKEIDFKERNLNNAPCISISEVLGMISEPFDSQGVAEKTYNKHFNNPNSEYYQMSVEQILEKWSAKGATSRKYGSLLDDYIGLILNHDEDGLELYNLDYDREDDERLNGLCTSFDEFVKEILDTHPELEFVAREKTVWYKVPNKDGKELYIKGRFDCLFYNKVKDRYLIVDWKSSDSIDKKPSPWTSNLLGPCKDLLALNSNTYTLQVYFYKTALTFDGYIEEGKEVDCIIVQLPGKAIPENNGKFYMIHTPSFPYTKEFMDKLFVYAHKKKELLEKKNNQ